jgi:addiction module RelE/StbE family toxin
MKEKSSPHIIYTKLFNKHRKALPLEIKIAFREARDLFLENPKHPSLRNHPLKSKFQGYRSIDITEDYRVIFKKRLEGKNDLVIFYMMGTHEDLYGK